MIHGSLLEAARQHESGNLGAAVAAYRAILEGEPAQADALRLLGVALTQLGDIDGAALALNAAIRARPGFVEAMVNVADLEARRGLFSEALTWYEHAIANDPAYAPAHFNLGLIHERLQAVPQAIAAFQNALAIEPSHLGALTKLAFYASQYKDQRALEQISRRLTLLTPAASAGWSMLGSALESLGRHREAIDALDVAWRLDPENADICTARGNLLKSLGRLDESILAFEQAVQRDPQSSALHLNLGIALLQKGDYTRGWPEYAWNWFHGGASVLPFGERKPLWDGSACTKDRRLLIISDQGNGDYIMGARYIERVRQLGAKIILESPPGLRPLFETCLAFDTMTTFGEPRDETTFDHYIPVTGLPRLFASSPAAASVKPYLRADRALRDAWAVRLAPDPDLLNVAIVWKGNPGQAKDHERSTRLEFFAHLDVPGIRFVALQTPRDEPHPAGLSIDYRGQEIGSFADSAAIMSVLDLVISIDSAPAHLAGALGVPTAVLLAFDPHWMYGTSEATTPWYPSMRLFRQQAPGDWPSAFASLRAFLMQAWSQKRQGVPDA